MTIVGIEILGCLNGRRSHAPQADHLPESRGTQMFAAWAGRQDCLGVHWVKVQNA